MTSNHSIYHATLKSIDAYMCILSISNSKIFTFFVLDRLCLNLKFHLLSWITSLVIKKYLFIYLLLWYDIQQVLHQSSWYLSYRIKFLSFFIPKSQLVSTITLKLIWWNFQNWKIMQSSEKQLTADNLKAAVHGKCKQLDCLHLQV